MTENTPVIFRADRGLGAIQLNRAAALNSLNIEMCEAIREQLVHWAHDDSIRVVVITGQGDRAFCAGGDVRWVYHTARRDPVAARRFFAAEYAMDSVIATYPKPYVSLIDGIAMGGGLGISVNGRYRVATEHLLAAMPETGIGLLPDVGATSFLNSCPGRTGLYLGLTGTRLNAADALYAGFATHFVPRTHLETLVGALASLDPVQNSFAGVESVLQRFAVDPGVSELANCQDDINRLFAGNSVESILHALDHETTPFAAAAAEAMRARSPTSLRITARQLTTYPGLSVNDALILEYRIVCHVLERHDFFEGVRAAIIDKDRHPRWKPDSLDGVTEAQVEAHFASLKDAELNLPEPIGSSGC